MMKIKTDFFLMEPEHVYRGRTLARIASIRNYLGEDWLDPMLIYNRNSPHRPKHQSAGTKRLQALRTEA